MRLNKVLGCLSAATIVSALAVSTACSAVKIDNANADDGESYFVDVNTLVPEGCNIADAKYAAFKFSGFVPGGSYNGAIVFNREGYEGGKAWSDDGAIKWGSDDGWPGNEDAVYTFDHNTSEGSIVEVIRPIEGRFDNVSWGQIWVQHYWPNTASIKIEDVYLLDENKQPLAPKAAETTAPAETEAPAETTTAASTTAAGTTTTAAGTTATTAAKATAQASTNPDTGDSGVALAVAAAFASAGVAVSFGRKKER